MRRLEVHLNRSPLESVTVGELAEHERRVYFEFDAGFLRPGLPLSPFKLPCRPGLHEHVDRAFGPLPGLFDDSLPDGWGLLLIDRHLRSRGIDPRTQSPLDRLAYLGTRTMGALTYHPPEEIASDSRSFDLAVVGDNAEEVFAGDEAEVLPQLLRAGGSPGGARPKVLVGLRDRSIVSGEDDLPEGYEHWIVKFAARAEAADAGSIEHAYALMAKAAGIDMPTVRLFESPGRRWFGVARFDRRAGNRRVHVHTFGNLIHANFRIPSTDYGELFRVTRALTRDHRHLLQMFRRMVFNVAAHVRDDHAKNFAFMLEAGEWSPTPAYDLTFSAGPGGEHSLTVRGEGRAPDRNHCLDLGAEFGVRPREAADVFDEVNAAIARWTEFADRSGCTRPIRARVGRALRTL